MSKHATLPVALAEAIRTATFHLLGGERGRVPLDIPAIEHQLALLDPLSAPSLCRLIGTELYMKRRLTRSLSVNRVPELMMCDRDGHVREAAIRALRPPAPSAFHLAMLIVRLNDWVPTIRTAAATRFDEFWNLASPSDRTSVAALLLDRERMRRMTDETSLIDRICASSVFRQEMIEDLATRDARHSARLFYLVRRQDWSDPHLGRLAQIAPSSLVRAKSLEALVQGRTRWRTTGRRKEWIDKSIGRYRLVPVLDGRPVRRDQPLAALINVGLRDGAANVRRVAAQGLIEHPDAFPDFAALCHDLLADKSIGVVERAAFGLRQIGVNTTAALTEMLVLGRGRAATLKTVIDRTTAIERGKVSDTE